MSVLFWLAFYLGARTADSRWVGSKKNPFVKRTRRCRGKRYTVLLRGDDGIQEEEVRAVRRQGATRDRTKAKGREVERQPDIRRSVRGVFFNGDAGFLHKGAAQKDPQVFD